MGMTSHAAGQKEEIFLIVSERSWCEYSRVLVRCRSHSQAAGIHRNAVRTEYDLVSVEGSGPAAALLQNSAQTIGTACGDRSNRRWMRGIGVLRSCRLPRVGNIDQNSSAQRDGN